MTSVLISIVVLYIIAILFLGIIANRKSKDTSDDYFIAGRSLSWFHLSLTLFATWMSTFAFLGSPGFYFKNGVRWFLPHGFLVVASPALLWFIGRKIWYLGRAKGFLTPGDLLGDFYQSKAVKYLVAIISILALVPYSLIQLVGIGKALDASTNGNVPYWAGIGLAVFAIAFYTYFGGIRAIVWTDILQGIIFGLVMILGGGIALFAAKGFGGISKSISTNQEAFLFDPEKFGSPLTTLIIWTFGYILLPHMWQRIYMAKSAKSLSRSVVIGTILAMILIVIPSLIMGTLGIGFMPGLEDSDKFVPTLYSIYFAPALPLLILATFAAGMSTIDSQMISASSVFVRDIAQPLFRKEINTSAQRKIGRYVVLFLITLITFLALSPKSQGSIIPLASKGTGIALLLLVPLLGPLAWQKASKAGGIASLLVGSLTLIILDFKIVTSQLPFGFGSPIAALLLQLIFFVLFSLIFPRKEDPDEVYKKIKCI